MDPKPSDGGMLLASSKSGASALRLPASRDFPPVDEHIVQPETTRDELIRGRRVVAMPALPPHADRQVELGYVIRAHIKPGFVGSAELLTRVGEGSDFATDVCVRKQGTDPITSERHLEELAFEVVNEQSMRDITEKAEDLTSRGVRRVVAIFVKKGEACEWKSGAWKKLDPEGMFSDPTLARPLRVRALLDAAEADNAVAGALLAKGNPVMARAQEENLAKGRAEGLRAGVRDLCELLGIPMTAEREEAINGTTASELDALRERIKRDRRWD